MSFSSKLEPIITALASEAIAPALANLPLVGEDLSALLDQLDLDDIKATIDSAVSSAEALADPANQAAALAAALDDLDGIAASAAGTVVTVTLTADTAAMVDIVDGALAFGGSAFSLDARADFDGSIDVAVDVSFTYDAATDMLTLEADADDEVTLNASISADVAAEATLAGGFVTAMLTDVLATPEIGFFAGVNVEGLTPTDITFTYGGSTQLSLDLATTVADNLLPGISARLDVTWNPLDPAAAPMLGFSDVGISLGDLLEAVNEVLTPVTDILFEGIIGKIVNILTEPVPIIHPGLNAIGILSLFDAVPEGGDGIFNLLDGLGLYFQSQGNDEALGLLSSFAEALAFLKQLKDLTDEGDTIPLGAFSVDGAGGAPASFAVADIGGKSPLEFLEDLAVTGGLFQAVVSAIPGISGGGPVNLSDASLTDESGLSFPLFENPELIVDILLPELTGGGPVSLIEYDIPAISGEARFGEYFFRVFGPFGLTIDGFAQGTIDFKVGYDTYGLMIPDGTFLDGLYLTTEEMMPGETIERQPEDRQFEFRPIAYASAGIFAGVAVDAVVLRVGVSGGIVGFVAAFLPGGEVDTDAGEIPNGVIRLQDFGTGCFLDPILGRIGAEVVASIKVGYGFFSFEYDVTIADITLANFEFGCPPATEEIDGLASVSGSGALLLHVGPLAGVREIGGITGTDDAETYRLSVGLDEDGLPVDGSIRVEYQGFFQNFGVEDGETAPTVIGANFSAQDDALVISADMLKQVSASGGAGNDILEGAALDDNLDGGADNDRLFGRAGNDVLNGGAGDDYLEGGAGADTLSGGAGDDRVSYENSATGVSLAWNGSRIIGSGGEAEGDVLDSIEYLVGSTFNDVLTGNPFGENKLQGNAGDDVLIGGSRRDLLLGDAGADLMLGGGGSDGTSYATSLGAVRVDLATGTAFGGDAEGDVLVSIENVMGSAFYDVLEGTSGANILYGWAGDDVIDGRGGDDDLVGDLGDDTVYARGDGANLIDGGDGRDLLSYARAGGGVIVDLLAGTGRLATNVVDLDMIEHVSVVAGGVTVETARSTFEDLDGSTFGDVLTGDGAANTIQGLGGDDVIDGGAGDDILRGGLGADAMEGGGGTDWADYTDGFGVAASLSVGIGVGSTAEGDTLSGIENLRGSAGSDVLLGDGGDNVIAPGLSATGSDDVVVGGAGTDTLEVDYSDEDFGLGVVGGLATGRLERLSFDGTTILDGVRFAEMERLFLTGTIRDDDVTGGDGDDRIFLGGGNDTVDAGSGADVVRTQEGDDAVAYRSDEAAPLFVLDGGRDFDTLDIDLGALAEGVTLRAGAGVGINLILSTGASAVNFEVLSFAQTGDGADVIEQQGRNDNTLRGGGAADVIDPGQGIDVVNGGSDVVTDATEIEFSDLPYFLLQTADQFADFTDAAGDRMILDWSGTDSAIISDVVRYRDNVAALSIESGSVLVESYSHRGSYETADGLDRVGVSAIESVDIAGGRGDDAIMGMWAGVEAYLSSERQQSPAVNVPSSKGNDVLDGGAGDDVLRGLTGFDVIRGGAGDDTIYGTDPGVLTGDTFGIAADRSEIDTLTGGAGADLFVLGIRDEHEPGDFDNVILYTGRIGDDDATDNRAVITDFDAAEGDRLQLAGTAAFYDVEVIAGGVNILLADDGNDGIREIIAFLDGLDSFALTSANVTFVNGGFTFPGPIVIDPGPIVIGPGPIFGGGVFGPGTIFEPVVTFASAPAFGEGLAGSLSAPLPGAAAPALVSPAAPVPTSVPPPAQAAALVAAPPVIVGPVLDFDLARPTLTDLRGALDGLRPVAPDPVPDGVVPVLEADDPWVAQTNLPSVLGAYLFENTSSPELRGGTFTLEGDARAFGIFDGDPFGLGQGVVLSTGQVADLDGVNEIDGGLFGPYAPELVFEDIGRFNGSTIYRADLSFVGTELNSITVTDDGDAMGGGTGAFSGTELDALVLSRQFVSAADLAGGLDLNAAGAFERLNVFDYSSAFNQFAPGTARAGSGPSPADFQGTQNGIIDLSAARLGEFDYSFAGSGSGSFTLGDGGSVGFDLTETVDTDGPLYLYVAEGGDPEELAASITASDTRLAAPADLSTDFGAEGAEDDLIRLTYSFDLAADAGKLLTFDYVLATEELREFAGTEFNDSFRIFLNGVQLAKLTDGTAATVNQLQPAPFAASHPDLMMNPVGTGPAAAETRADAYTVPLTFVGRTQAGRNTLVVEVEDVRDGLMDSAILVGNGRVDLIDDGAGLQGEPGVSVQGGTLSVTEGGAALPVTVTLTGVAALGQDAVLTLTPGTADIDLGSGAGVAHQVTIAAGGAMSATISVSAPIDGIAEPTEFVLAGIEIAGGGVFDGLPVAPLVVQVIDAAEPENQAPVAGGETLTTAEDTDLAATVAGNDTDADGDALTYSVVSGPSNGTLTLQADGSFTYAPDADFNGTDAFTYAVSDGAASDTATAALTVTPVNDAPVAIVADLGTVGEDDVPVVFDALGAVVDIDSAPGDLSVSNVAASWAGGALTATLSGGTIAFDPGQLGTALDMGDVAGVTITFDSFDGALVMGNALTLDVTGADEEPGLIRIEGTDDRDRLFGTGADEAIASLGGRTDYMWGGGGADTFVFGDETVNGIVEVDYIYDFDADDTLDIGDRSVVREVNAGTNTYLVLDGDGDRIMLLGASDYDDGLLSA